MVAGNIPGRTRTLALAIFSESQQGHDERAMRLVAITVALAFAALWTTDWLTHRRARTTEA
jgi:molybdate transport system permease protein